MKKNYSHVFISGSAYSLLIYLLIVSMDKIKDTFFFFLNGFPVPFRGKLLNSCVLFGWIPAKYNDFLVVKFYKTFMMFWVKILHFALYPFLDNALLFASDISGVSVMLIGKKRYVYLEEGLSDYAETDRLNVSYRFLYFLLLGPVFKKGRGRNLQAEKIILTGIAELPDHYKNRNVEIVSMERLWQESSKKKKNFILNVFDLTPDDLVMLRGCDVIFLSQPLAYDGYMTEAEQIEMTRRILAPYEPSRVFLKPHPRDSLKYAELFPDVRVWSKPTPMELISLCGAKFQKVVTVNSTAALSLSCNLELEWLGKDLDAPCFSHLCEASRKKFNRFAGEIPLPTERLVSA